jgi:hypothetical protein
MCWYKLVEDGERSKNMVEEQEKKAGLPQHARPAHTVL